MSAPSLDLEQARLVGEDLAFLVDNWTPDATEAALRVLSPILYRLLVDGHLHRVARALALDVWIRVPESTKDAPHGQGGQPKFWQAGGGQSRGLRVEAMSFWEGDLPAQIPPPPPKSGFYNEPLSKFGQLPAFVIDGIRITKAEVIKYMTDKLGGRHYDPSRGDSALQRKYLLLDGIRAQWQVTDKNVVSFAILSIGQAIRDSRDVGKVRRRIAQVLLGGQPRT